jgi:predicted DNA-binding ribbon-helix-helix protein
MKSPTTKRSIVIGGHKTSISLEEPFWTALKELARQRGTTLSELVKSIDTHREHANLSSAVRLFVLAAYRNEPAGDRDPRVSAIPVTGLQRGEVAVADDVCEQPAIPGQRPRTG